MNKSKVCTIENIIKHHKKKLILGPLSLSLNPEEILGIRGANGAGKSTLIKIIAGIINPDSGTVNMPSNIKKDMGYVPQDVALYSSLSGRHNLDFWAGVYGLKGKERKNRINWLLEEMHLLDKGNDLVQNYSGGMRRRLNLAAALLKTPKLLLLDEPTVGADLQSVEIMLSMMEYVRGQGATVVFISHRDDELKNVCDRIITIEKGLILNE